MAGSRTKGFSATVPAKSAPCKAKHAWYAGLTRASTETGLSFKFNFPSFTVPSRAGEVWAQVGLNLSNSAFLLAAGKSVQLSSHLSRHQSPHTGRSHSAGLPSLGPAMADACSVCLAGHQAEPKGYKIVQGGCPPLMYRT